MQTRINFCRLFSQIRRLLRSCFHCLVSYYGGVTVSCHVRSQRHSFRIRAVWHIMLLMRIIIEMLSHTFSLSYLYFFLSSKSSFGIMYFAWHFYLILNPYLICCKTVVGVTFDAGHKLWPCFRKQDAEMKLLTWCIVIGSLLLANMVNVLCIGREDISGVLQ